MNDRLSNESLLAFPCF